MAKETKMIKENNDCIKLTVGSTTLLFAKVEDANKAFAAIFSKALIYTGWSGCYDGHYPLTKCEAPEISMKPAELWDSEEVEEEVKNDE